MLDALLWLLALELAGLAALPVAAAVFSSWPDRGYALAKMLGLVLIAHAAWLTSILGLTGFTAPTVVVLGALLALVGWKWLSASTALRGPNRRLLALEEAGFVLAFLGATLLRAFSPAIAGQEKPMDLMFLHALIRVSSLPAEDPWLAGSGLPYYYFGYLTHALLAKVTGLQPAVAYNLAVGSVLALAAVGAFGLAVNVLLQAGARFRTAVLWGLAGTLALTCLGNLEALIEVLAGRGWGDQGFWMDVGLRHAPLASAGGGWFPTDGAWWFRAARVIPNIEPDGITEFPYFSFLLGDLHPHYMALPLAVLIVALAVNRLLAPGLAIRSPRWPIQMGTHAIVLGAVIPTNTWDVPVLWGAFAAGSLGGVMLYPDRSWERARTEAIRLALLFALAAGLYAPYFVGYASQGLGFATVADRTPLGTLVILFGPLLVLPALAAPLAVAALGVRPSWRPVGAAGGGALLAAGGLAWLGEPTLAFLVAALAVWGLVLWWLLETHAQPVHVATAGLVLLGLGAILVPELVFLRDVFGSRMNTVFKFYYDAWLLLALAAPLVGHGLWVAARNGGLAGSPKAWFARAALGLTAALALGGALYPLGATGARTGGFAEPPTLDGMVHLRRSQPDDSALIDWLRRVEPGARVIEAVGDDYSDAARLATFAGTVAPIGWVGHELQWRGQAPELSERRELVRAVYTDPVEARWREALKALSMEFVVVGSLERQLYGPQVDTRFEGLLEPMQRAGQSVIYRIPGVGG